MVEETACTNAGRLLHFARKYETGGSVRAGFELAGPAKTAHEERWRMEARIYQPTKTTMQSGTANSRKWRLEFEPEGAKCVDSLIGWTGSSDMRGQLSLGFETREAAVAFCDRHGIPHRVQEPHKPKVKPKSYADNFRYDRVT